MVFSSMEARSQCGFLLAMAQAFGQVLCWDQTRKSIKSHLQSWLDLSAKE